MSIAFNEALSMIAAEAIKYADAMNFVGEIVSFGLNLF